MGNSRKNALPGVRSEHADDKKSDNHQENPEFHKAWPEQPGNLTGPSAALRAFPGDAFKIGTHGFNFFAK